MSNTKGVNTAIVRAKTPPAHSLSDAEYIAGSKKYNPTPWRVVWQSVGCGHSRWIITDANGARVSRSYSLLLRICEAVNNSH